MVRTLDISVARNGTDVGEARTWQASLLLAGFTICPGVGLIGAVAAMRSFIADIFCLYALAAVSTLKEVRMVAVVTSRRNFVLPIVTI